MTAADALVTGDRRVVEIAERVRAAGRLHFDLEFVSEARFIPELALVQVSWGDLDAPEAAMIDCLAADPAPIFAVIEDPEIEVVAHAATQDLGLLATRFEVTAQRFRDTQIAAAFAGLGDQIGYANLVRSLLGEKLDKGAQFTDWLRRPLSEKQLRYALNDVLYLPRIWDRLCRTLEERGRLGWVVEESRALAAAATGLPVPDQAYLGVRGARGLDARQLGALRALAAWRQQTSLDKNKPLGWVLPDKAMIEVCRKRARSERDLAAVRGIGDGTIRRYGAQILEQLQRGAADPVDHDPEAGGEQLSERGQIWAAIIARIIDSRCAAEGIAPRFVGTRSDAEALVQWYEAGATEPSGLALLDSWRRELVGDDLLAWLRGERALVAAGEGPAAVELRPVEPSDAD